MITVKILKDSINPAGVRITTWILRYQRFIHSEFMTHRSFSRNAASSRAIPIRKMLKAVIQDPAVPEFWGANQSGMQAYSELKGLAKLAVQFVWRQARWFAVAAAWTLDKLGAHKQIANRILEPWSWITIVATATEHNNFFSLRAHPAAQPEFQVLAYKMLYAFICSEPQRLEWDQWHLPFATEEEIQRLGNTDLILRKQCVARCARVSYLNHDGKPSQEADFKLFKSLSESDPMHASAFEHCALACKDNRYGKFYAASNFDPSWVQYRKTFKNEAATPFFNLAERLTTKPGWIEL